MKKILSRILTFMIWSISILSLIELCFIIGVIHKVSISKNTIYSDRYTEERFDQITCLIDPRQATELLGIPLSARTRDKNKNILRKNFKSMELDSLQSSKSFLFQDEQYLELSFTSPKDRNSNWKIRTLLYDNKGQLVNKRKDFYVD